MLKPRCLGFRVKPSGFRSLEGQTGRRALRALRFVLLGVFRVLSLGSSLGRRRHPHLENIPAQVLFLRFSGLVLLCGAKHGNTTTLFRLEFSGLRNLHHCYSILISMMFIITLITITILVCLSGPRKRIPRAPSSARDFAAGAGDPVPNHYSNY